MTEIYVALMGVTGAGKSSFIKLCSANSQEVKIGHTLDPCTAVVDVYQCQYDQHTTINLIDTPGFDDANRTDTEVLREITPWLTKTYRKHIRLSGIIYLHRITDIRMQGSARRNLSIFKALCGPDALKNVVLATSMWDKIDESEGQKREDQLRNTRDWWGWMCEKGSTVLRHDNTRESAFQIIGRFIPKPTVVLQIQHDLVDLGKTFDDTDAGVELNREKAKADAEAKEKMDKLEKEFQQAIEQKDQETMDLISELRAEAQADRCRRDESYRRLQISMDQIQQEQRRYRDLERQFQNSQDNHRMELEQLRNQLGQQLSLAEYPPAYRPQRRHGEHPTGYPQTIQGSAPNPASVPAPMPPRQPTQAKPSSKWDRLEDGTTVMCTIKYKTKLKHWMGSDTDKDIVFKMCNAKGSEDYQEYPMPKRREEFLNLLQRTFVQKITMAVWDVKEDVLWTPKAWFPTSKCIGKESNVFKPSRVWESTFNEG